MNQDIKVINNNKDIKINNMIFDLNELYDLLYEISNVDVFFTTILINDFKLKKDLEDLEIIGTNNKGSSFKGKKFKFYFDKIKSIINEEIEYEDGISEYDQRILNGETHEEILNDVYSAIEECCNKNKNIYYNSLVD